MNKYQKELQALKPSDEIQTYREDVFQGYGFITTAGHGYLVVPTGDANYGIAKELANYGFIGKEAVYLEEDFEASEFLKIASGEKEVSLRTDAGWKTAKYHGGEVCPECGAKLWVAPDGETIYCQELHERDANVYDCINKGHQVVIEADNKFHCKTCWKY